MYCNNNTETALHAAVKGKHYDIAVALINAGANPNLIIKPYHDVDEVSYAGFRFTKTCRRTFPDVELLFGGRGLELWTIHSSCGSLPEQGRRDGGFAPEARIAR